jgi:hypothetical protein
VQTLEKELLVLLLPGDPLDEKNIMLEIRAGTGGDEASIWAGDLVRMYQKYCTSQGWKNAIIHWQDGDAGGYKSITLEVQGDRVYSKLKYEAGTVILLNSVKFWDLLALTSTARLSPFCYLCTLCCLLLGKVHMVQIAAVYGAKFFSACHNNVESRNRCQTHGDLVNYQKGFWLHSFGRKLMQGNIQEDVPVIFKASLSEDHGCEHEVLKPEIQPAYG